MHTGTGPVSDVAPAETDAKTHPRCDVLVVGAGPVGLFSIFQCGMLGLTCQVIDALDGPGGQCTALYAEKPIYDIPGIPRITAGELIERLVDQARPFQPRYHFGQQVRALEPTQDDRWRAKTNTGTTIDAGAVMIAAGAGMFQPNRPQLPNISQFEAGGCVRYDVDDRNALRNRRIVIGGGGDSAVDWAIDLVDVASKVSVVHRRDKFRAATSNVSQLRRLAAEGRLDLVVPYQLAGVEGEQGQLETVVVADLDGATKRIPADVLLAFYGLSTSLGPIAEWGLNTRRGQIAVDPLSMETNRTGIFAIGDIAAYPRKLKLILTGFSEAATAAHAIRRQLYPDQRRHFAHSTITGVPNRA